MTTQSFPVQRLISQDPLALDEILNRIYSLYEKIDTHMNSETMSPSLTEMAVHILDRYEKLNECTEQLQLTLKEHGKAAEIDPFKAAVSFIEKIVQDDLVVREAARVAVEAVCTFSQQLEQPDLVCFREGQEILGRLKAWMGYVPPASPPTTPSVA